MGPSSFAKSLSVKCSSSLTSVCRGEYCDSEYDDMEDEGDDDGDYKDEDANNGGIRICMISLKIPP